MCCQILSHKHTYCIFTALKVAELYDYSLRHSFVLSVSKVTHQRFNIRRPNMVGMGMG